ncbi:MAG: hypothetical protein IJ564_03980 [Alphaproteobacteria bacterium]|nr:hypothetical protein [Alphaproteobacteria bacterium]
MSFVIFDTEYTTWQGCQENGWHGNQKKEIVQISALKVTDEFAVIGEFNVLCRPEVNPILSDYFVNLTHITNENVRQNGKDFLSAYSEFKKFVGRNVCFSHSWGADLKNKSDGNIINENLFLHNKSPEKNITFLNIAPIFAELYKNKGIDVKSQSSGQIVKILGLTQKLEDLQLDTHNAFYDVYSVLEGLKYFLPESSLMIAKGLESAKQTD